MSVKRPLLFDLDGTLVDSARSIATALSLVSKARGGPEVAPERVRPLVSRGVSVLVREALGPHGGDAAGDVAEFRERLVGLPADADHIYPGVTNSLSALAEQGHAMAIVTNKPEGLARKLLSDLELDSHFRAVVGGDTLAAAKPDAAPLHHALTALGHEAEHAVMIGDSEVDARAAAAAGCAFLLFEGGYGPLAEDAYPLAGRFGDFDQLAATIAALQ